LNSSLTLSDGKLQLDKTDKTEALNVGIALEFDIFVLPSKPGFTNSNCPEGPMRTSKITRGPYYDVDATTLAVSEQF